MTKQLSVVLLLLFAAGTLTGCGKPVPAATLESAPSSASSAYPEGKMLVLPGDDWGYPSPFAFYSRGPGYIRMSLLFDTLTWKDEHGVIPWLAREWIVSDDGTEWTFTLAPDVTWHDGEALTAHDVAFTFEYFKANQPILKWPWPVHKIQGAKAVDDETVILSLTEPMAGAHKGLIGSLPIIPKHVWEDVDDPGKMTSREAVIGSGPFELLEYSKEEGRYAYEANVDYFQGAPTIQELTFIKVGNQALALETETTDYASFWGREIEAVNVFQGEDGYGIIEGPNFWVLQMIFNTQRPPFDDLKLRRAVAYAVDRGQIVDQVSHGGAIVGNLGILSPFSDWYNPDLPAYEHDPQRAEAILEEVGAVNLSLTLITTARFAREAELIQGHLEAIGLEIEIQTGDYSTIDGLLREGNFDLAINGHGGIANPAILETPTWPAQTYDNLEYDELFQQQAATMDGDQRQKLVSELQETIAADLPVFALYHPKMWTVYDASKLDTWFYTEGGVGFGIPIAVNKVIFLP